MEQARQKMNPEPLQKPTAPTPLMAAVIEANKAASQRQRGDIPQFNLAEQIMAQQRKAAAVKRKAPSAKITSVQNPPQAGKPRNSLISMPPRVSIQAKIIAEIVTRDIRAACCGKSVA